MNLENLEKLKKKNQNKQGHFVCYADNTGIHNFIIIDEKIYKTPIDNQNKI